MARSLRKPLETKVKKLGVHSLASSSSCSSNVDSVIANIISSATSTTPSDPLSVLNLFENLEHI